MNLQPCINAPVCISCIVCGTHAGYAEVSYSDCTHVACQVRAIEVSRPWHMSRPFITLYPFSTWKSTITVEELQLGVMSRLPQKNAHVPPRNDKNDVGLMTMMEKNHHLTWGEMEKEFLVSLFAVLDFSVRDLEGELRLVPSRFAKVTFLPLSTVPCGAPAI